MGEEAVREAELARIAQRAQEQLSHSRTCHAPRDAPLTRSVRSTRKSSVRGSDACKEAARPARYPRPPLRRRRLSISQTMPVANAITTIPISSSGPTWGPNTIRPPACKGL